MAAIGTAVAAGIAAVLACLALRRWRRRRGWEQSSDLAEALMGAEALLPPRYNWDVFLSYRRDDFLMCDLVAALLEVSQVRVFKDRAGHLAGRPFDQALATSIWGCHTFSPIITLASTRKLTVLTEASTDYVLVEYILGLHWHITGRIQRIYPLLVGCEALEPGEGGGMRSRLDLLPENADWRAARAALPDVVPAACLGIAASLLRCVEGEEAELAPCLRSATVAELMCASAKADQGGLLTGILTYDWCELTGASAAAACALRSPVRRPAAGRQPICAEAVCREHQELAAERRSG